MTTQFEFIIADPSVNLKPGKSSLIRSRCMQGKNKREGSRRSVQSRKKERAARHETNVDPLVTIPPSLHNFVADRFASHVDAEGQELLLKAFAYNLTNQSMSPLDRCVDFDRVEADFFTWLYTDSAFLHCILSISYAVNDIVVPTWNGQPGKKVVSHLRDTLSILAKKMDASNAHEDEAVLYVVINLALLAAVYGDWAAASAHFAGLHKIVQLRGGIDFLRTRPIIHFKLDRLDLAWSLSSGKAPLFLHPVISWDPLRKSLHIKPDLYKPPANWDVRLTSVFCDFQYLTTTINENVHMHARYNATCFQSILSTLQSRLIHLAGTLTHPIEELIRLSLLVFLTTTFKVPGRKIPYTWIAKKLAAAYASAEDLINSQETLQLWVIIMAAISVSSSDEPWLVCAWRVGHCATSWNETRKKLSSVMWIDCIHDQRGEIAHNMLTQTLIEIERTGE
ncbi:hypothetical protein BKA66DRAFT_570183 [Pyrenochaeta sp. MPI-SDFR-AT-0127]|nr:hypothetical protein BKA66DRAFT_570183 [Pyrenochaeta sp. MPI-SDFR-AT-0127]